MPIKNKAFFLKTPIIYFKKPIIDKWNNWVGWANNYGLFLIIRNGYVLLFACRKNNYLCRVSGPFGDNRETGENPVQFPLL